MKQRENDSIFNYECEGQLEFVWDDPKDYTEENFKEYINEPTGDK